MRVYLLFLLLVTSCVKVEQANDFQVNELVKERTGKDVRWAEEDRSPIIPQGPISCDEAVQVALFNNRRVQAEFERLGIAQAELLQASLINNPVVSGYVRFPMSHSSVVNTEASFTQSFLELFLIPLRKKVAQNEFEKTELEVATFVLNLIYDVRLGYYGLQALFAKREIALERLKLLDLKLKLSLSQHNASTISPLEYMQTRDAFLYATLALYTLEQEIQKSKKSLAILLGIDVKEAAWQVQSEMLEPKGCFKELDVAKRAKVLRLDLALARHDIKRYIAMGREMKWWAKTEPATGVSYEKDADKITVLGPTLSFALPLFDYGQADRARLIAYVRQSRLTLCAKEQEILHEVAFAKASLAVAYERYMLVKETMLPLTQERLFLAKEYYDVMALGLYTLMTLKEEELSLRLDAVDALTEYWTSYITLEKSVGGHIE